MSTEAVTALVVLVTTPDAGVATSLASLLVEERLAACGNVLPGMTSVYRWQGAVQRQPEALLILKTTAARFDELSERVREFHPYDVPEVIAMQVADGSTDYLDWLADSVTAGGE